MVSAVKVRLIVVNKVSSFLGLEIVKFVVRRSVNGVNLQPRLMLCRLPLSPQALPIKYQYCSEVLLLATTNIG